MMRLYYYQKMEKPETKTEVSPKNAETHNSTRKLILVLIALAVVLLICGVVILILLLYPLLVGRQLSVNNPVETTLAPTVTTSPGPGKGPATVNLTKVCDTAVSPLGLLLPEGWTCTVNSVKESGIFKIEADSDTASHVKVVISNQGTDLPCFPDQDPTCQSELFAETYIGKYTLYRNSSAGLIYGMMQTQDPGVYMTVSYDNMQNVDLSAQEKQLVVSVLGRV
jgi:hypothetical protein